MRTRTSTATRARQVLLLVVIVATVTVGLGIGAGSASGAASSTTVTVKPPKGAAKPVPGSGVGTKAAMEDPRCRTGSEQGVYGNWDGAAEGSGPPCVVPLKAGKSNGGATSQGVTADSIKIVFFLPKGPGTQGTPVPTNRGTGSVSTWQNVLHDQFTAMAPIYETWGRKLDITFLELSGNDEAAQRADALKALALKPFAVDIINTASADVLASVLAKAKVLVFTDGADTDTMQAQAPYSWALTDPNAALINAANAIAAQLGGARKAEFGGDDVKGESRVFALVHQDTVPVEKFVATLASKKVRLAFNEAYQGGAQASATVGDPALAAQQAPQIVAKMKGAGVTTVVGAADSTMLAAMMKQANDQNWHPEWFLPGTGYVDYAGFIGLFPAGQLEHTLGLSILGPAPVPSDPENATLGFAGYPLDWYWGPGQGSDAPGAITGPSYWLLPGIHMAGPKLTPKNFEQGLFAIPMAKPSPLRARQTFGGQASLGYDTHGFATVDYAAVWLSPTEARTLVGMKAPSPWFVNNGRKYAPDEWPKTVLPWFDQSKSISGFDSYPPDVPRPVRVPCDGCPSSGNSTITPGAPSQDHIVIDLPVTGPAAAKSS